MGFHNKHRVDGTYTSDCSPHAKLPRLLVLADPLFYKSELVLAKIVIDIDFVELPEVARHNGWARNVAGEYVSGTSKYRVFWPRSNQPLR